MLIKNLLFCCLILLSQACCSDSQTEQESSAVEKATKEVADEMVERIRRPIDKAEAVKEIEQARRDQLKEQTQ